MAVGCIKSKEVQQRTTALVFQLVPRDQRGWVWQGLILIRTDQALLSLVTFSKNFHRHRFMAAVVC